MAQAPRRRPNHNRRVDWTQVGSDWLHFFIGHPVRVFLTIIAATVVAAAINPDGVGRFLGMLLGNIAAALTTALGNALTALLIRLQPYYGVLVFAGCVIWGFWFITKPLHTKRPKK